MSLTRLSRTGKAEKVNRPPCQIVNLLIRQLLIIQTKMGIYAPWLDAWHIYPFTFKVVVFAISSPFSLSFRCHP